MAVEIIKEKKKQNATLYPKSKGECVYFVNDGGDVNGVITENIITAIRDNINTLTDDSVKWISENKSKYICYGTEALSAMNKVLKVYKNGSLASSESQKSAVEGFFKYFVNNIWIYENGVYDKRNAVVSKWTGCYFVGYRNYDGEEFFFPLAVLKSVFNDESYMEFLIEGFSLKCSHVFVEHNNKLLSKIGESSSKYGSVPGPAKIVLWFIWVVAFVVSVFSGIVSFFGKLSVPEWSEFSEISGKTNGFFQTLRVISSTGFEMNINDTLIDVVLVVSAIGLLLSAIGIFKFLVYILKTVEGTRNLYIVNNKNKVREYIKNLNVKFSYIGNITETLRKIDIHQSRVIKEKNTAFNMYLKHSKESVFAGTTVKKQSVVFLVVLFALISSFTLFVKMSSDASFRNSYNEGYSQMRKNYQQSKLCMNRQGVSSSDITVYALPDNESVVLCNIVSGEKYSIVEEKNPVEGYSKTEYDSEYGTISGWIATENISSVTPGDFDDIHRINPYGVMSSTDGKTDEKYAAINVLDNNPGTVWKINKDIWNESKTISEFVEIYLTENTEEDTEGETIHSIGFTIGNGIGNNYADCARPSELTLEFYENGRTKKTCNVKLLDMAESQYYYLNSPVTCDSIRVHVCGKLSGEVTQDVYMSDIHIYAMD